jgi:hypothetical protein
MLRVAPTPIGQQLHQGYPVPGARVINGLPRHVIRGQHIIPIGLQAKGTALIHRRDLTPLANLELYSVAPTVTRELYRQLGINAGRHAKGSTPEPARNPYSDEAIEARYHTKVVSLVAIERECADASLSPEHLVLRAHNHVTDSAGVQR